MYRLLFLLSLATFVSPADPIGKPLADIVGLPDPSLWNRVRYRALSSELDDPTFEEKWKGALGTPLALMRAFEPQYYDDMSRFSALGPIGICHGDAHFDNFGFLVFGEGVQFVIDDIDDSGYCPVVLDILRLLIAIQLDQNDKKLVHRIATVYTDLVDGKIKESEAPQVPKSLVPKTLLEKETELLKKHTKGDRFILGDRLRSPDQTISADEVAAAVKIGHEGMKILDVAEYAKPTGGSGGLQRFWILHEKHKSGEREILELKHLVPPATAIGKWGVNPQPRLEWATQFFWKGLTIHHYRTVKLKGMEFGLRSRTKASIPWDTIDPDHRERALAAEAAILAKLHKSRWKAPVSAYLLPWLEKTSAVLAERNRAIYEKNR